MDKEKFYRNYLSTFFGTFHASENIDQEYRRHAIYFRGNHLKYLPRDRHARILDAGCGMGHFLYFLKHEGYTNVIGVDVSPESVAFCTEHGFTAELGDLFEYLANHEEVFDVIVLNDVLEHQIKQDVVRLLQLIRRALRPQGVCMVKVPNAANPILGSASRYYDFTHEVSFTQASLSQVFAVAGFSDVTVVPQKLYVFYWNPLNYFAWFISWTLYKIFRFLFILHGNTSVTIFTKDLIAVARS